MLTTKTRNIILSTVASLSLAGAAVAPAASQAQPTNVNDICAKLQSVYNLAKTALETESDYGERQVYLEFKAAAVRKGHEWGCDWSRNLGAEAVAGIVAPTGPIKQAEPPSKGVITRPLPPTAISVKPAP
jgi:hypothetical protein